MVEFKRKDTLGGGLNRGRNDGLIVGHIRKRRDTGAFRYFRGESNELNATYSHRDLEALKRWVRQHP